MRRLAYGLLVLLTLPALVVGQVTVTSSSSALSSPVVTPDPLDFSGVTNFTSTLKVYQTSTHSGNNWLGLADDATRSSISSGHSTDTGANVAVLGGFSIINTSITNNRFFFDASATPRFQITNTGQVAWSNGDATGGTLDTFVTREAAAIVQMGLDVNGAAIPQTLKAADGITGTDIIGSGLTLAPGKGTGAGVSQPVTINRDLVGATGTTAQTQGTAWVSCPSKILSNTTGTAQTIATITTTSTTAGAINMFYTVTASNGTVLDADSGESQTAWNNNAGTVAATMAAAIGGANSAASGTLATAPTATVATNVVSIKFTPAWTVIVPTVVTGYATFAVNGVNSIACQ